jgi:uncharacterized membrane protein YgcG
MAASDDDAPVRPDREEHRREEHRREEHRREELRREDRREDRRDDRDRDGDSFTETLRQRLEQLVPDLVKKTFAAGMGAVFQTEEGIRRIARENLPEVAGYIASSADGAKDRVNDAKDRVFDVIARETREFLSNLNVGEEVAKILTTLSFEIKTEIRFIPNSERFTGAEPDVKASVRLKRNDRDVKDRDGKDRDVKDRDDDDDGGRRSRLRFWQRDRDPGRDARDVVRDGVRDGSGSGSGGGGGGGSSGGGSAGGGGLDRDEDDNSGEK